MGLKQFVTNAENNPLIKRSIDTFSLAQATSNDNGKTSGSGTMGVIICTVGSICFLLGAVDKMWFSHTDDIMSQTIIFTGIGASLLAARKFVGGRNPVQNTDDSETPNPTSPSSPLNS